MKIALDLDETITSYPEFFSKLSHLWDDEVYVITFRQSKETSVEDCRRLNIKYTDIIIADTTQRCGNDWKVKAIEQMGIKVFFDDMPEVLIHAKKNVAAFLVRGKENFDFEDKRFVFTSSTGKLSDDGD
jgi:hypothetical protein